MKLPTITQDFVKQVWTITDLNMKKETILNFIGEDFNTASQGAIRVKIKKARSCSQLDIIVSNMLLVTENIGVK